MMRTNWSLFWATLAAVGLLAGSPEASAQEGEDEEESALKSGQSVRRKLLYRSTRFEVSPMIGVTSGDAYIRNGVVGANIAYYLTNTIGLGLSGGYSPLHTETRLAKNVKASLDDNAPGALQNLTFSYLQWFGAFEIKYVPIFGKFSLMNETSISYDLHLVAGAAMMGRQACNASDLETSCAYNNDQEPVDESMGGIQPAAVIGGGFRMFLGDAFALNLQIRDHLYRRALVSTGAGESQAEFSSNVYLSIGFSLFFPQTVKISR